MKLKSLSKIAALVGILTSSLTWAADKGSVAIDIELQPTGSFTAHAETLPGAIEQQKDLLVAKNIVFSIADLSSGIELRDKHMKDEYFEVEKFPKATLKAAKGKKGKFVGILNVHGVDSKVAGTYKVSGNSLTALFKATLSQFKIKKAAYMGVGVTDEVNVTIKLPLK